MSKSVEDTASKRLVKTSLFILFFLSALILSAPLIIEWAVVDWLKKNGVTDAAIDDIELNPFTGEFSLSQLSVGQQEGRRFTFGHLYLQLDYLPLFEHRIEIKSVKISGIDLDLKLDDDHLTLGALLLPERDVKPATSVTKVNDGPVWHFGLEQLQVDNLYLRTHLPTYQGNIKLNRLKIEHVASWLQHQYASIELDMVVDGAKIAVNSKVAPFKPEPALKGEIVVEAINFEHYAELAKLAGIDAIAGQLAADLRLDGKWLAGGQLSLLFEGDLNISKLLIKHHALQLHQSSLKWRGKGAAHYPSTADSSLLKLQSKLSLTDLSFVLSQQKLAVQHESLKWDGSLRYQEDSEKVADGLQLDGNLVVDGLTVIDQDAELKLLSLQQANLSGLVIDGLQDVRANQLTLKQLTGLGNRAPSGKNEPQQLFAADELVINEMGLQQLNRLTLNQVDLQGMKVVVIRNPTGDLKWLPTPAADKKSAVTEDVNPEASRANSEVNFSLKLNRLNISDESSIQFQDASVEPAYEVVLTAFQLEMTQLDMSQPDQATNLMVKATIDKYSSLDVEGTVHPFQQPLSTALKADLKGVDLTSLSPYIVRAIGYDFRRGRLDSKSSINIDHGKLNINNELHIAKLTIIEADPETAANFSETLIMPLDAALGILRDSDDNIAFNLPITGDLSAPEFSMSGVVNLALTNALKSAAMSYVTNALQPLGTVLMVYDLLEKVTKVRFQPLEYDPGSSDLKGKNREYAEKVATLLLDRPTLNLTLCGVVNSGDKDEIKSRLIADSRARAAEKGKKISQDDALKKLDEKILKSALLEMADERSSGLKAYLIERGVKEGHLFTCRPMIDLDEGAKARVELTL